MDLTATFRRSRQAARRLLQLDEAQINRILLAAADAIPSEQEQLLAANAEDLARMEPDSPLCDRLRLTPERLSDIADGLRHVAALPSPLGRTLIQRTLPNGLELRRVSVPFGVIGVIYEARPNVTFDVFALCLKAGSACVLKGGHDADASNRAIAALLRRSLESLGADADTLTLLPPDREAGTALLQARGLVDLVIPRGSSRLIRHVRENALVPIIETGAGVCHAYFDRDGDLEKGRAIINNAKTRRVSVCNALDCLLIHRERLADLAALCAPLLQHRVRLHADSDALEALRGHYPDDLLIPSTPADYGTEYLSYAMAIRSVSNLDEALEHIALHGSGHSECIITENSDAAERFTRMVDAACVYTNAPTSFTDGAQFGLGAEIGISTQKLHARGPMGLEEITTYKWIIRGQGQTRP